MRVRSTTTGALNQYHSTRTAYIRSNCTAGYTVQATFNYDYGQQRVKTITDVETPRFHSLLKCGKFLPINPVEIVDRTETRQVAEAYVVANQTTTPFCQRGYRTGPFYRFVPWSISVPAPNPSIITAVGNAAISDAKSAIWDALTWIGELKETREYFHTVVKRIDSVSIQAAKDAFRRSKRSGKSAFDIFPNTWLEYRYAIRPLMFDFQNVCNALANKIEKGQLVEGHGKQIEDLSNSKSTTTIGSGSAGDYVTTDTIFGSRTYRGFAYAGVENVGIQVAGVDPLSTFWELTRLSFVLDWAIDINSWLKAISPFTGAEIKGAGVSIKEEYTMSQSWSATWSKTESGLLYSGSGYCNDATRIEVKSYTRSSYEVSLPGWNPRLTTSRWIDLASIIYGIQRKVFRTLSGRF